MVIERDRELFAEYQRAAKRVEAYLALPEDKRDPALRLVLIDEFVTLRRRLRETSRAVELELRRLSATRSALSAYFAAARSMVARRH